MAICGSVNTADGTYRWSDRFSVSVSSQSSSRFSRTTRASWLATCLS